MVLCKFYQEGRCNRGNSCSFEHVAPNQAWRGNQANAQTTTEKYNETSIRLALNEERPPWHLSVFGPAKEEPNMIVGTDRSPEEDRMLYYMAMRQTGNVNQYIQMHENALQEMNKQVNAIQGNARGAIHHYEKEKSASTSAFGASDPNKQFTPYLGSSTGGAFGGGGAFGLKPSVFGGGGGSGGGSSSSNSNTTTSAFGGNISKPAFGQSAFGSTSTFGAGGGGGGGGAGGASAFGQPSALGSGGNGGSAFGKPSAFGQPSALGGGSAFGQPSALGAGSAFGQPSALGGGSAFGQTSALGGAPAFGQPSALGGAGSTAFGQPSALGGGVSAFGQPSALGAFGSTSTFGNSAPAFGATPAFGAPASAAGGGISAPAFGATSALGAFGTSNSANAFGQPQQQQQVNGATVDVSDPKFAPFKQDHFEYKLIPEIEPPMSLR